MRFVVSGEWTRNSLLKMIVWCFLAYTLSELIVRLILAPLSALAAAVLFFELKGLRGEPVLEPQEDDQHLSQQHRRRRQP